ncbi:MAG TPA: hypothetical protein PK867_24845 [Pirellulales bacterium]|nr:hypothetical protein [Pirellulales bacterium]
MIPPRPPPLPLPAPISLSKLLLVEGDTPMHFFEALLLHLNLSNQIAEFTNNTGYCDSGTIALIPWAMVMPR